MGARYRARREGLEFNLDPIIDVCVPRFCPVLGIPILIGERTACANSPTLDRIDPTKGYVRGNVIVVSHKANTIKSNATIAEIRRVVKFYSELAKAQASAA